MSTVVAIVEVLENKCFDVKIPCEGSESELQQVILFIVTKSCKQTLMCDFWIQIKIISVTSHCRVKTIKIASDSHPETREMLGSDWLAIVATPQRQHRCCLCDVNWRNTNFPYLATISRNVFPQQYFQMRFLKVKKIQKHFFE